MQLIQWFQDGGSFMWFIVIADFFAIVAILAVAATCTQARKSLTLIVMLIGIVIPLIVGAFGHYLGYVTAMAVIPQADPALQESLFKESMLYAMIPSLFGGISSLIMLLLSLVAFRFSLLQKMKLFSFIYCSSLHSTGF